MESLKNIHHAARILFFLTGFILFFFAWCIKNGVAMHLAKLGLFLFDIPFMLFAITFLISGIKLQEKEHSALLSSFISFFAILFFGVILFFHFAYPDLI